ncbi:Uncharacterised protein [Serratia marcescens]|nr:Uncharacterised protein [Serratia marcescens]
MNQIVISFVYNLRQVNSSWILFFNRISAFISYLTSQPQQKHLRVQNSLQSQSILYPFLYYPINRLSSFFDYNAYLFRNI